MITALLARLATLGDLEAIVHAESSTTYAELADQVDTYADQLRLHGIIAGRVVALEAGHSSEAAAALLALVSLGAVCVPMTDLPAAKAEEFREVGEVESVVSLSPTDGKIVHRSTGVTAAHPLYARLGSLGHPGLVLFSSGTTGRAKASVLDLDKVLARYLDVRRGYRTLSFLNLDHIGGINTLLHTLSQGGTLVTIPQRTPDQVFATIAEHRVEVLPTTPTFLTMTLIDGAHRRHDTSSLTLITYGTEPMPPQTLGRMATDLPDVRLKQTYGLSELGIMATSSRANDSLWVRLGGAGFEHKVVDGVLWIRSEMAMLGYLNAEAPFDDDGFFNTQDAVEVDGEYLHILGRTSELINVGGEKVYPNEVESVLLEIDNIADVTVSALANPVTGHVVQAVVSLVEPEDRRGLRARVDAHCRTRLDAYKVPAKIVVVDSPHHSDRFKKRRA